MESVHEDQKPYARIFEVKQALDARIETGGGRTDPEGTLHMLAQMRGVLSRELDRFAGVGSEVEIDGKAAVDLVSLIARTLEKIDQLERQMAEARSEADGEPSTEERASLRQTVHAMIDALAERKVLAMREAEQD